MAAALLDLTVVPECCRVIHETANVHPQVVKSSAQFCGNAVRPRSNGSRFMLGEAGGAMLKLKERPFLEIANLFFLVALCFTSIWDSLLRPDHPISSLVVGVCVVKLSLSWVMSSPLKERIESVSSPFSKKS